jgi:hypothetical protein
MEDFESDAAKMAGKSGKKPGILSSEYRSMYKDKPKPKAPPPDIEEQTTLGGPRGTDAGELGKKWNELFK